MEPVVGTRVRVYWPEEQTWFEGTINAIAVQKGLCIFQVAYDDGDMDWRSVLHDAWQCVADDAQASRDIGGAASDIGLPDGFNAATLARKAAQLAPTRGPHSIAVPVFMSGDGRAMRRDIVLPPLPPALTDEHLNHKQGAHQDFEPDEGKTFADHAQVENSNVISLTLEAEGNPLGYFITELGKSSYRSNRWVPEDAPDKDSPETLAILFSALSALVYSPRDDHRFKHSVYFPRRRKGQPQNGRRLVLVMRWLKEASVAPFHAPDTAAPTDEAKPDADGGSGSGRRFTASFAGVLRPEVEAERARAAAARAEKKRAAEERRAGARRSERLL